MSEFARLYDFLEPLSSQPECRTCRKCEEHVGLVYLLGDEAQGVEKVGGRLLVTSRGVQYLSRTAEGWCSCFDPATNQCRIYAQRPLCCRIYPLDLMHLGDGLWWVIHSECPIAQRLQAEHRLDILYGLTVRLEGEMSKEEIAQWTTQDDTSRVVEAFLSESAKVLPLRRFRASMAFP